MQKVYLTPDIYYEYHGRGSPWNLVETDYPVLDGRYLISGTRRGKPVYAVAMWTMDGGWDFEDEMDVIDAWMKIPEREEGVDE